jgi:hypothetical protein
MKEVEKSFSGNWVRCGGVDASFGLGHPMGNLGRWVAEGQKV